VTDSALSITPALSSRRHQTLRDPRWMEHFGQAEGNICLDVHSGDSSSDPSFRKLEETEEEREGTKPLRQNRSERLYLHFKLLSRPMSRAVLKRLINLGGGAIGDVAQSPARGGHHVDSHRPSPHPAVDPFDADLLARHVRENNSEERSDDFD